MSFRKFYQQQNAGYYFLLALCLFFLFAEIINDRFWMSDLEVYYRTAGRLLNGDNLYRYLEDGHYVFKYSPVSAAYFIPLVVLPFIAAKILYWLLLTWVIITAFRMTLQNTDANLVQSADKTRINNIILIGGIFFAVHYLRELHLGQVNFLLLAFYIWSAVLLQKEKSIAAGFLIAATLFMKPFGLIFIPWLVLLRRFRDLTWIIVGIAVLSILPLLFYRDFSLFISQYQAWLNELSIELGNKQSLFKPANHTLTSVIARYTPIGYLIEDGSTSQKVYQMLVIGITALLTAVYIRKPIQQRNVPTPLLYDLAFLSALIPLLSYTSENAFLFVLPAALLVLVNWRELTLLLKGLSIAGLLLTGGNFSELTGKKLSRWLEDWSVLTPGTILLLVVLFLIRVQLKAKVVST